LPIADSGCQRAKFVLKKKMENVIKRNILIRRNNQTQGNRKEKWTCSTRTRTELTKITRFMPRKGLFHADGIGKIGNAKKKNLN
jgi:hypothetical protein